MRNRNLALAAMALAAGSLIATPTVGAAALNEAPLVRADIQLAQAKKMTRAEMDAKEREITKQLNEAQLKK